MVGKKERDDVREGEEKEIFRFRGKFLRFWLFLRNHCFKFTKNSLLPKITSFLKKKESREKIR